MTEDILQRILRKDDEDEDEKDPLLLVLDEDEYDQDVDADDDTETRSRQKHDIFHIFKNLPLGLKIALRHIVSRLLIHATFVFNKEDFEIVSSFVQSPIDLNDRRCAWFPACGKLQRECGGNRKDLCDDFKNRINDGFIAQNDANKRKYNLKRKIFIEKERRIQKKRKNNLILKRKV